MCFQIVPVAVNDDDDDEDDDCDTDYDDDADMDRVAKCQFFYTEQNPWTKFYPKKSA